MVNSARFTPVASGGPFVAPALPTPRGPDQAAINASATRAGTTRARRSISRWLRLAMVGTSREREGAQSAPQVYPRGEVGFLPRFRQPGQVCGGLTWALLAGPGVTKTGPGSAP